MTRKTFFTFYFIAIFLQSGSYGLTFLLPPLFDSFGANAKDVGTVLAITAITTILSVLYLGHITAKLGRMNTIVISGFLIAISLFCFGFANGFGKSIYIASALLGIGWGLFYVLTPVVLTQVISVNERVRFFTLLSVFIMAGFGLSPVLGAQIVYYGFGVGSAFIVVGSLCLISMVIFFLLTKPVLELSHSKEYDNMNPLTLASFKLLIKTKAVRPIIMVWLGASVFAGVTNFQTVYANLSGLEYSDYFLAYTITVIVCRILFAEFMGGHAPYAVIGWLLAVMVCSVALFIWLQDSRLLYVIGAILFGIGYGVSYPILKAMATIDADPDLISQTLQVFGLTYFVGVFGFPFVAGWIITESGMKVLLSLALVMAIVECFMAFSRYLKDRTTNSVLTTR